MQVLSFNDVKQKSHNFCKILFMEHNSLKVLFSNI